MEAQPSAVRVMHNKKQITNVSQFEQGRLYLYYTTRFGEEFAFKFKEIEGDRIKIETEESLERSLSLADMGVVPYPSGMWNSHNYVVPV